MTQTFRFLLRIALLSGLALALVACRSSTFDPPELQGAAALIHDAGQPRLWVLTKQEESRQVGVGTPGNRGVPDWRTDTFFHFAVQAFDPLAARPLWKRRLLTIGDDEAGENDLSSRVIGSSVDARLLGQEGALVWLLVGAEPFAVDAHDGHVVADSALLQTRNPELVGLLPSEAKHYAFDRGLVLMAADARRFVVRGARMQAAEYTPPPPAVAEAPPPGARRTIVPMRPLLDANVRNVVLDGQWFGLYTVTEAADAESDEWGENLQYPYSITDDGSLARRSFWRATITTAQKFDDRFERISDLAPVAGAPVFLRGRFLEDPRDADKALLLDDPAGALVWHSTRIDNAGRLAVTRLDRQLKPLWTAELPLSENSIMNPVAHWLLPGHLVVMGELQFEDDHMQRREPHLVGIDLADGSAQAWNMTREAAAAGGVEAD